MTEKENIFSSSEELKIAVDALGKELGLISTLDVKAGRRIWGAKRHIDVVFIHPESHLSLGIECRHRIVGGSTERFHAIVEDLKAWPIKGIIVISKPGFSDNFRLYLQSTGCVVEYEDLEDWVRLFFGF